MAEIKSHDFKRHGICLKFLSSQIVSKMAESQVQCVYITKVGLRVKS